MPLTKEIFEITDEKPKPQKKNEKAKPTTKNIKRSNKMTEDEIELLSLISKKLNPEKPKQTRNYKPEVKEKMLEVLRKNMKQSVITRANKKASKQTPPEPVKEVKSDVKPDVKPEPVKEDNKMENLTKLLNKLLETKTQQPAPQQPAPQAQAPGLQSSPDTPFLKGLPAQPQTKQMPQTIKPWWQD